MMEQILFFSVLLTVIFVSALGQENVMTSGHENESYPCTAFTASHTDRISGNIFDFGLRLQKSMLLDAGHGNVVMSPTSIAGVLALTLLGSVGKTYDELVQTLGFSTEVAHNRDLHRKFGNQLQNLNSELISSKTLYANAVFVDKDSRLRQEFKEFVDNVYHASVSSVDFTNSNTTQIINQWVSDKTQTKISKLLAEPLSQYTKVLLASALYFKGQWLQPFLPQFTHKTAFSRDVQDPSKDVTVNIMVNFGKFPYVWSTQCDCELVGLPYNDSTTTFYAIKPINPLNKSLDQLLSELNAAKIEKIIEESKPTNMLVKIPKMKLSTNTDLSRPLKALGIQSLFSPDDANFALMVDASPQTSRSNFEDDLQFKIGDRIADERIKEMLAALPNPRLYVTSVLHNVGVSIDEYGTEAVAATAGIMARTLPVFFANSPFFFFIRNEPTGLVTFSAAVYDPTE